MSDCCRATLDAQFGERAARRQLNGFRRSGPGRETKLLIDALSASASPGATVLDIGAGIGAVAGALLERGAARATSIDASVAYAAAARTLAAERGYADRVTWIAGDFVDRAAEIPAADIVALDKVICCYPDAERLVALSAARAGRAYGYVLPRDGAPHRMMSRLHNLGRRLARSPFRTYVHAQALIDGLLRDEGLRLRSEARTLVWTVRVHER